MLYILSFDFTIEEIAFVTNDFLTEKNNHEEEIQVGLVVRNYISIRVSLE